MYLQPYNPTTSGVKLLIYSVHLVVIFQRLEVTTTYNFIDV